MNYMHYCFASVENNKEKAKIIQHLRRQMWNSTFDSLHWFMKFSNVESSVWFAKTDQGDIINHRPTQRSEIVTSHVVEGAKEQNARSCTNSYKL